MEANAMAGGANITLPAGSYTLSIVGADEDAARTGDLDIAGDLSITGAGAESTIIDARGLDRVLHILTGGIVQISGRGQSRTVITAGAAAS